MWCTPSLEPSALCLILGSLCRGGDGLFRRLELCLVAYYHPLVVSDALLLKTDIFLTVAQLGTGLPHELLKRGHLSPGSGLGCEAKVAVEQHTRLAETHEQRSDLFQFEPTRQYDVLQ